jgi:hypothetical protein
MVSECSDVSEENTASIFKVTELFQHLLEIIHSENGGILFLQNVGTFNRYMVHKSKIRQ